VLVASGNPGTGEIARNVLLTADDDEALIGLAQQEKVGLVVIGPEAPLVRGLADRFRKEGIPAFGPGAAGAELEGSKAFAKNLMSHSGVPTASYRTFDSVSDALSYLGGPVDFPLVVKASGLAAGKGVVICPDVMRAEDAVKRMMIEKAFGQSGATVILEGFLAGEEVSVHSLCDGKTFHTLPTSQDHKRVFDRDEGPNTGGMGAFSPATRGNGKELDAIEEQVIVPTMHALRKAGRPFRGVLYSGLMMTRSGPKVLEYNVRFGDPETQVVLPRLRGDLGLILLACAEGRLQEIDPIQLEVDPSPMITVVMTSSGYPGPFEVGRPITGIDEASKMPGVHIDQAGTAIRGDRLVTAGGRVLSVSAKGSSLSEARNRAYAAVELIHFEGAHYRKDIGERAARST
jgi:phosphoribosylamine--glycine ligase